MADQNNESDIEFEENSIWAHSEYRDILYNILRHLEHDSITTFFIMKEFGIKSYKIPYKVPLPIPGYVDNWKTILDKIKQCLLDMKIIESEVVRGSKLYIFLENLGGFKHLPIRDIYTFSFNLNIENYIDCTIHCGDFQGCLVIKGEDAIKFVIYTIHNNLWIKIKKTENSQEGLGLN